MRSVLVIEWNHQFKRTTVNLKNLTCQKDRQNTPKYRKNVKARNY